MFEQDSSMNREEHDHDNISKRVIITPNTANPHVGSVSIFGTVQSTPGNVTLNPSDAHIGSVSIFGSITANTGMNTLFPGPNQIGSVTVSNFTAPNTGNVTLNPSSAHIGSVSLFGNIPITMSSISLYPSSANIGSVSILGGVVQANAGTNLNTSLLALEAGGNLAAIAASLDTLDSVDYFLGSDFVAPNVGNVTLNPSSAHVGSVSIFGAINLGQVTLFPGPNQIGSVTVSNFTAPNVGNVTLNASSANIGSVSVLGGALSVSNFVAPNLGNVSLNASSANIGSVSILGGVVAVTQSGTWDEVGINDSGNSITVDATNLDIRDLTNTDVVTAELSAVDNAVLDAMAASLDTLDSVDYMLGSDFVAPNIGNVTLNPSPNFIGNVTTYPGRSLTTSMATIYSGAGNYTLFVPPTGQKFFVHNLMVNAQGVSDGHIKAGVNPKWPWAGLATYGGFAKTFTDPGLAMGAVNEAFVVTLNSAATISVDVGVHFE